MALGRYIKEQMLKVFDEKLNSSNTIILCSAANLKAGEMDELRAKMDKAKNELFLIKNTLALQVFKKAGINAEPFLQGDTYYAFSRNEPVEVSKILVDFARGHEALKLKAGIIQKKVVGAAEIKRYAGLPAREILIQTLVSRINAPLTNLALVLNAPMRKLVLALRAIKEQKEKGL